MAKELQWDTVKPVQEGPAFILGSSPSVLDEPLELLNGQKVYLVNKAWKALEMGLLHKANGLMYTGLMSWVKHIDEMKQYGLDAIPKFYSDLVVNSHEFQKHASKHDNYYLVPKRVALSQKKSMKNKYLPDHIKDGIGKTGSVTLDMIIVCYLMGFKKIYVLGMDCDYRTQSMYFFEGHTWDNQNASIGATDRQSTRLGLSILTELLANKGVELVQLSRGYKPNPEYKFEKAIKTARLEDVVSGYIYPKTVGILDSDFYPLQADYIDTISKHRKKCHLLLANCKNDDMAKIMSALRFVDKTIKQSDAVAHVRELYPHDKIRFIKSDGTVENFNAK